MEVDEDCFAGTRPGGGRKRAREGDSGVWELEALRRDLSGSLTPPPCFAGEAGAAGVAGAAGAANAASAAGAAMHWQAPASLPAPRPLRKSTSAGSARPAGEPGKRARGRPFVRVRTLDGRLVLLELGCESEEGVLVADVLDTLEEHTQTPRDRLVLMQDSRVLSGEPGARVRVGSVLHVMQQFGSLGHPDKFSSARLGFLAS
jgi:hypothetical protein